LKMATKRMTGNDYKKELKELNKSIESIVAHVESRLLELIRLFPDAVVVDKVLGKYLCKNITKTWFQNLSLETKIAYIINIEKWNTAQQKVEQLTIDKIYKELPSEIKKTLDKLND